MLKKNKRTKAMLVASLAAGSLMASGCSTPTTYGDSQLSKFFSTPQWMSKAPWSKDESEHPVPYPGPVKVASTWTPDVLIQTGRTPTRGFGGRLFFFDEKTKAVPVEGTLTVHGFETGKDGKDSKIKPFKFTPEQFTKHYSQSDFGASYSIWIPWDAAGGEEKRISLVATFQTTSGKIVQGSPTTVILPGTKPEQDAPLAHGQLSPQYERHTNAIAQHATRPSGLVTTTIRRNSVTPSAGMTPDVSIHDRINSIANAQRLASPQQTSVAAGETPYIEVPLSRRPVAAQAPDVMTASALMPTEAVGNEAPKRVSAPRRIASPATNYNR